MQMEFQDSYIVVILLCILVLCCCRQVLETTNCALTLVENFVERCACGCCSWIDKEIGRRLLIVYCFMLPVTYQLIFFGLQTWKKTDWASSVIMSELHLNSSAIAYSNSVGRSTETPSVLTVTSASWYVEVDYMFCVMPFALAASLSCWIWVCLSAGGDRYKMLPLDVDTVWDGELPPNLLAYEVAYMMEIFALNFSMVAIASSERSFVEVIFASMSLSFVMCIFISFARHTHSEDSMQQALLSVFFLLLGVILMLIWGVMMQHTCVVSRYAVAVHGVMIFALVMFHFSANGAALASTVILMRTVVTVVISAWHIIILVVGRNHLCLA